MTYPVVDMDAAFKAVKKKIAEAQHADAYRDNEAKYDKLVMDTLDDLLERSVDVIDQFHALVDEKHALAKKLMDEMQAIVKRAGKSIGRRDVDILETSARNIKKASDAANAASNSMINSVGDFRGGQWLTSWGELLDDKTVIRKHATLTPQKMNEGKVRAGLLRRMEDYCKRADALVAAARHAAGQAGADAAKQVVEFGKYATDVDNELDDAEHRVESKLASIRGYDPKHKLSAAELKVLRSLQVDLQQLTKKVRGISKTLDVKIASFKKVQVAFDAQQRQSGAEALRIATAAAKKAQTIAKALAKSEAEADKRVEAIAKLK